MQSRLDPPRVALIGVSGYARLYYQLLSEAWSKGEIQLVAVVIINTAEERDIVEVLRRAGCSVFGNYREMLSAFRDKLDLCCIPTGITWHARMTVDALQAGAHVLVEKPLAVTLEEVASIRAAEAASGKFVAVAFQDLYLPVVHSLKRDLLAQRIGRINRIDIAGLWPRGEKYYGRTTWAGRLRHEGSWVLDSPVSNGFAHFLNLALFFAGSTDRRFARMQRVEGGTYRAQAIESFDTFSLRFETIEGIPLSFSGTHSSKECFDPELTVIGSAGSARWKYCREVRIQPAGAEPEITALPDEVALRRPMFAEVIARLRDPGVFICTTEMAAEHTRCVAEVHRTIPIVSIDRRWLEQGPSDDQGGNQVSILGIETWVLNAYREGKLFQELGCPWASPAPALLPREV